MKYLTLIFLSLLVISCGRNKKELEPVFNEKFYVESVKDTIIISFTKKNQNLKTILCKLYKENDEFYTNDFEGKKVLLTTKRRNTCFIYNSYQNKGEFVTAFKNINDSICQTLLVKNDIDDDLNLVIWYTHKYEIKGIMWIGYDVVYNQRD